VLHNFLIGRILLDDDRASAIGRSTVEKRIQEGVALTPLGLRHPPVFSLLYENSESAFGRSRALRCPHYIEEGGRCGIWRNRESTCVTWFCKHVRGRIGYAFWRDALHRLLLVVENDLARWCVQELDIGADALRRLVATASWQRQPEAVTGETIDNSGKADVSARLWGRWTGRAEEFFVECAKLVEPLSWSDVLRISGPEARAYAQLTQNEFERLRSAAIPSALQVGQIQLVKLSRNVTRVSTYSSFDPIEVPNVIMESLHYFDGRPTEQALAAFVADNGLSIEQSLLQKMVDFELLVASE